MSRGWSQLVSSAVWERGRHVNGIRAVLRGPGLRAGGQRPLQKQCPVRRRCAVDEGCRIGPASPLTLQHPLPFHVHPPALGCRLGRPSFRTDSQLTFPRGLTLKRSHHPIKLEESTFQCRRGGGTWTCPRQCCKHTQGTTLRSNPCASLSGIKELTCFWDDDAEGLSGL